MSHVNRIADCFAHLAGKKALIPYITAGYPSIEDTVPLLNNLVASGADIIELGVPFSDPIADGPVIQMAYEAALAQGVNVYTILDLVARFRQTNQTTPIILMGYLNPIEKMGYKLFAEKASQAGVDGVLIVDVPPEESSALIQVLRECHLDSIYLLTPTTKPERMQQICQLATGFVYYVSLKGVTGANTIDSQAVKEKVSMIKSLTSIPVGVGFGIKDASTARSIADLADAIVIGSAIIKLLEQHQDNKAEAYTQLAKFIQEIRQALDEGE